MGCIRNKALLGLLLLAAAYAPCAYAARIRDLCEIQGARGNSLKGIGLVVGLAGTGDGVAAALRAQERILRRMTVDVDSLGELNSDNVAVVWVTATLPAFAKEGTRIDVQVSSVYDAESLEGGTLLETHLLGADNEVYALAQGPISVGGFNADAGGASVRQNHVTSGRVPMGAYVEREVPSTITDGERIMLLLKNQDFTTASHIEKALNDRFGERTALALGAGAVNVRIPESAGGGLVSFIAEVQTMEVEPGRPSKVVINERTGTIVVGGDVEIKPCQVAHGSLTIEIAATPAVSQPNPLAAGETVVTETTEVSVKQEEAYFMDIKGTSAADVANALNKLKVTPRDMIAIFQALREAGALEVDLEIM